MRFSFVACVRFYVFVRYCAEGSVRIDVHILGPHTMGGSNVDFQIKWSGYGSNTKRACDRGAASQVVAASAQKAFMAVHASM